MHDCSCADHAVISDLSSFQDDHIGRDPTVIPNGDRCGHMLIADTIFRIKGVVIVENLYPWAKSAAITNGHSAFHADHQILVEINPVANLQFGILIHKNRTMSITDHAVSQTHLCAPVQAKPHLAVEEFHTRYLQLMALEKSQGIQLYEIE